LALNVTFLRFPRGSVDLPEFLCHGE
jgi:hypothetical protein